MWQKQKNKQYPLCATFTLLPAGCQRSQEDTTQTYHDSCWAEFAAGTICIAEMISRATFSDWFLELIMMS